VATPLQFNPASPPPPPLPAVRQRVADANASGHISSSERSALDMMWSRDLQFAERLEEGGMTLPESLLVSARRAGYETMVSAFTLLPVPMANMDDPSAARVSRYDSAALDADRLAMLEGVGSKAINREEFGALEQFTRETETLRADLREGGFTLEERAEIEGRMSRYDDMLEAFSGKHAPTPEPSGGAADAVFEEARETFGKPASKDQPWSMSPGTAAALNDAHDVAHGEAVLERGGPVYTEERASVRAVAGRERVMHLPSGSPAATPPEEQMQQLAELFPRVDADGDGQLTRQEVTAAVRDPEFRGDEGPLLAATLVNFNFLADPPAQGDGTPAIELDRLREPGEGPEQGMWMTRSMALTSSYAQMEAKLDAPASLYGESGRPDPASLQQGSEGDCWFLGPVSALQPEQIQDMITEREDGQFEVRFPGHPEPVTVAPPTDGERAFYASANGTWVNVLEKAAREIMEGQGSDLDRDWPGRAMELVTGVPAATVDMYSGFTGYGAVDGRDPATVDAVLRSAFADGRPVVADVTSESAEGEHSPLPVFNHVWSVSGYDAESQTVTVRNTWGRSDSADTDGVNDGTFTMPLQEFQATFSTLTVGRSYADQPIL
jgi:hypothetical protein